MSPEYTDDEDTILVLRMINWEVSLGNTVCSSEKPYGYVRVRLENGTIVQHRICGGSKTVATRGRTSFIEIDYFPMTVGVSRANITIEGKDSLSNRCVNNISKF